MAFIEFKELNMLSLKCGHLGTNNRLVGRIPLEHRALHRGHLLKGTVPLNLGGNY